MKEIDLAWAAGFIDGEGCLSIIKRKTGQGKYIYHQTNLNVPQINKDSLLKLQLMFGGQVKQNKKYERRRKSYVWIIHSRLVYRALQELLPYLVVKKNEAELLLQYQRTLYSNHHYRILDIDNAEREAFGEALKEHHQTYEYDEDGG